MAACYEVGVAGALLAEVVGEPNVQQGAQAAVAYCSRFRLEVEPLVPVLEVYREEAPVHSEEEAQNGKEVLRTQAARMEDLDDTTEAPAVLVEVLAVAADAAVGQVGQEGRRILVLPVEVDRTLEEHCAEVPLAPVGLAAACCSACRSDDRIPEGQADLVALEEEAVLFPFLFLGDRVPAVLFPFLFLEDRVPFLALDRLPKPEDS